MSRLDDKELNISNLENIEKFVQILEYQSKFKLKEDP